MRAILSFSKLHKVARRRLMALRLLVESVGLPVTTEVDRVIAYVTIESLNLWSSFARSYYLSYVFSAKRDNHTKVTIGVLGVRTTEEAIDFAVRRMKPKFRVGGPWRRRDEPTWHDPNTLQVLCSSLVVSNLTQIYAAFSYQTDVFMYLPTIRNFFAHRNDDTAGKVATIARSYGIETKLRPSEILCSRAVGRPQNVLLDWISDLGNVIELLCQ
jgi:hypothetical protein